ncbi:MAG TPA: N-acetylmuramoyl-L-alanine amidase [Chitinophagaceae bacterium]|nr:N-acetylmuramoyl-L-alanine amidase [Chitinophagaceae bacterium]
MRIHRNYLYLILLFVFGCSPNPYSKTNKAYKKQAKSLAKMLRQYPLQDSIITGANWVGTTNFNLRKPNFVIIHHTAQNTCDQTLRTFTLTRTQVSAHYVICRDGTVFHMLNDYFRAWHAGVSRWGNTTDINSTSIGIELDNNGFEPFADAQLTSLTTLLSNLKKAYGIPTANFIGHGDIAPTRKNDPNWRFPWKQFADAGYGLWYDDTTGVIVPENFDHLQALRIIGFDLKDTSAAILAFKRHFEQDTTFGLKDSDKKVLFNLAKKYQ